MKGVDDELDLSFEVKVVRGEDASPETVRFADLLTRPTVVSVYMRNNTGSCDKQNDALVADMEEIHAAGFDVIGLSRDTCGSHRRYAAKKSIAYPLVSDPEDLFAGAVDAVIDKKMYGRVFRGPLRSAWVLDESGKVLAIIDNVDAKVHGAQVLAAVRAL